MAERFEGKTVERSANVRLLRRFSKILAWCVVRSLAFTGSILAALTASGFSVAIAADETNRTLHLRFLEPQAATYAVDVAPKGGLSSARDRADEVRARRMPGPPARIVLRDRVVLGLADRVQLDTVLVDSPLTVSRRVGANLFVLQAPDAMTAALEADRLARVQGVVISHPVRKRPAKLHWRYAPAPNDTYFPRQWHLENRDSATGAPLGFDLGIRSAWADNLGNGVIIAIVDEGVATSHPDLAGNMPGTYDHNFVTGSSSGTPMRTQGSHGTAVAGLVAAVGNNSRGVIGVAPRASMASWVVFDASEYMVDEETMMDALQYCSNVVSIQNHSWGNASVGQLPFGVLEDQAIENAVTKGRNGLGVIMVRSAGNDWQSGNDVNDDGYGQDPRAIAVGAVRVTGRAASYTTPGAPVLVAAFSGDQDVSTPSGGTTNYIQLCTTDLQGALGRNTDPATGDYGFDSTGFGGTSGSAPQISGLCALMLNANPNLTWRDVQQILVLSARQLDAADPDTKINGAGLPVNHRVGFGVPDAGQAVRLAKWWHNRPPRTSTTVSSRRSWNIPDDGLRVLVFGSNVPASIRSIPAYPSDAPHPDNPTKTVPIVDVGQATEPIAIDLKSKAALIQRGVNYFAQKISYAAAAGAEFAVVYNNTGSTDRVFMAGADLAFAPIPAVFIDRVSGEALRNYIASSSNVMAQLSLNSLPIDIDVAENLSCEHVKLRVFFNHPRRADVRLTLVSPSGTRSVLHHFNEDISSPLGDWTFYSTHHFFEPSAGTWRIEVSDEQPGQTGKVNGVELTIYGVPITDSDHDGLDDDWEMNQIGTLDFGPAADIDRDGYPNLVEWLLEWDPLAPDLPLQIDLSIWSKSIARLSWPSARSGCYQILGTSAINQTGSVIASQPGRFPEMEFLLHLTNSSEFIQVRHDLRESF